MTCNECANYKNCPWNYLYKDTDYAEDCIDFKNGHRRRTRRSALRS